MIVTLDQLKRVLGLDLTDTSPDASLTQVIQAKTAWVEGETKRRFDTPILHEQYAVGGEDSIYLEWFVDDSTAADALVPPPSESIHVYRRPRSEIWRPWEELIEGEDWERRGQTLRFLRTWQVWPGEDEFKITYLGGYAVAPADIQAVILELSMNQYLLDTNSTSATAGITSESLGDYSYNVDLSAIATGSDTLTEMSSKTLNRYKRKFV